MAESNNQEQQIKHIIRVAKTDLLGSKGVMHALTQIKGIGVCLARSICTLAGVDKSTRAGALTEEQVGKLNKVIENPLEAGIPRWMANRRKNPETGKDEHVIISTLEFARENDIKRMKKIRCYRGVRHAYDQPVRGQRTRSHFRKNKGKVSLGVQRKKLAAGGKKEEGKK